MPRTVIVRRPRVGEPETVQCLNSGNGILNNTFKPVPPVGPRDSQTASTPRIIVEDWNSSWNDKTRSSMKNENEHDNGNGNSNCNGIGHSNSKSRPLHFDILGDLDDYVFEVQKEEEESSSEVENEVMSDGSAVQKSPVGRLDVGALPEDIAVAAEELGDVSMSSLLVNTFKRKKMEREVIQEHAQRISENSTERYVQTAFDTYLDMRQERALKRWEHYCALWENERKKLESNLSLPEEHPYIMDSADEYRKKVETLDALDRAVPLEERHGSDQWTMSLRNNWARYVPVGNIFSGLFCPVEERQKGFEDLIKVGKPRRSSTTSGVNAGESQAQRVRGWHQSSHLAMRLMQFSKRVEGFPKYNPDMTFLEVEGRSVVQELLQLADKQITLEELEDEVKTMNKDIWISMKEKRKKKEALAASNAILNDARFVSALDGADGNVHDISSGRDSATGNDSTPTSRTPYEGASLQVALSQHSGPSLSLSCTQLSLFCDSHHSTTQTLVVSNTGSTAIHFEWTKLRTVMPCNKGSVLMDSLVPNDLEGNGKGPPSDDAGAKIIKKTTSCSGSPTIARTTDSSSTIRFFFSSPTGCLLPGRSQSFCITFKSSIPGIYEEEWALCSSPKAVTESTVVSVRGVCSPNEDVIVSSSSGSEGYNKLKIEKTLVERVKMRQVDLVLNKIVNGTIQSVDAKIPAIGDAEDDDDQILQFLSKNESLATRVFYNSKLYRKLENIYDETLKFLHAHESVAEKEVIDGTPQEAQPLGVTSDVISENEIDDSGQRYPTSWDGSIPLLQSLMSDAGSSVEAVEKSQAMIESMSIPSSRHTVSVAAMRGILCDMADDIEAFIDNYVEVIEVDPTSEIPNTNVEEASVANVDASMSKSEESDKEVLKVDESEDDKEDESESNGKENVTDEQEENKGNNSTGDDDDSTTQETEEVIKKRSPSSLDKIHAAVRSSIIIARFDSFLDRNEELLSDVSAHVQGKIRKISSQIESESNEDIKCTMAWDIFDLERKKHTLALNTRSG